MSSVQIIWAMPEHHIDIVRKKRKIDRTPVREARRKEKLYEDGVWDYGQNTDCSRERFTSLPKADCRFRNRWVDLEI
jgi:hypothetical protein